MAVRIDQCGIHVPDGGVANKVCVVVEEPGGAEDFAHLLPFPFNYVNGLRTHQAHKAVSIRLLLGECRKQRPEE